MKISAFVLLLSLLANLSFANLSGGTLSGQANYENLDTVNRDGLKVNLFGDWVNIAQAQNDQGFGSLSILSSGKFSGTAANGQRVCGYWEMSIDGHSLVLHKICEITGNDTGTVIAKIELMDGHMLILDIPIELGGKQTFIQ